ncbi:DUF1501 domain-containing protein [Rubinisphaera italica]|uniref:Sulfatase n=1 Tax=Rubinisphaera italica TaxID=2527969 RepID=A0A5C5XLC9_9PLAN|nr:DUF1501 domain-containing protein [Rubinisphaera italica]TWT63508.1 hypothetical protein Pan54_42610 [Rubinisphaera italica]
MFNEPALYSRRMAIKSASVGFGYLAFAGLSTMAAEKENLLAPKPTHFPARAKHVIFLCMEGAPSHVDTFDYKPKLKQDHGKTMSDARSRSAKLLGSPWDFKQHGQSGMWMSELFPELSRHTDDLCMLHGMHTDVPAHPQAFLRLHTGVSQFKRPSLGSWAFYGLGTENENLPGFVTISPPRNNGGPSNYGSAFLPAICQGTPINLGNPRFAGARRRGQASPSGIVGNIKNPQQSPDYQRLQLDYIQSINKKTLQLEEQNSEVEGAIESLELAFRMQSELPELMELSSETQATQSMYGIGEDATNNFGRQCLLARRFVEAGVRFVEVTSSQWDHHRNLQQDLTNKTESIDKPIAGLLADLKQRDLLKDTLVIWSGEFGRTPYAQGDDGRDHNHRGFTSWMAGGGTKGGLSYGSTDDYGAEAVEGRVHIHDWHATILHLLGLNHEQLTYRYAGRDMRLTDVKGNVVQEIMS